MNATPYSNQAEGWDDTLADEDFEGEMPRRPRRQFLTRWSALLFALLLGAVGFFVGVRVEKGHTTSSSSGFAGLAAASRSGLTAASGASRLGASGSASRSSFPGGAGFAARFGGGTIGTVSSIDGKTLYVKETSGNTVKVTLSSVTKFTKSESVGRNKIFPGDSVTITGQSGSKGTITATAVSDSGSSSSSSAGTTASSGGSSGTSGVGSLFGG